jgi:hypothetical protein
MNTYMIGAYILGALGLVLMTLLGVLLKLDQLLEKKDNKK